MSNININVNVNVNVKIYLDEATKIIKRQIKNEDVENNINNLQPVYDSLNEEEQDYVNEQVLRLKIWLNAEKKLECV